MAGVFHRFLDAIVQKHLMLLGHLLKGKSTHPVQQYAVLAPVLVNNCISPAIQQF
jgi:hypothetical protein